MARRESGELTAERLGEIWLETQQAMFQGSVTLGADYGHWWSYVPHFLQVPGYVYAYSFGELLVLALFRLYQQRGADFVPKYLEVLAAGGSDWPHNILARMGVDLTDPAFWSEGLAILRDMVGREQALAARSTRRSSATEQQCRRRVCDQQAGDQRGHALRHISVWELLGRVVPLPIMLFVCVGLVLLPMLMSEDTHSSGSL